MSLLEEELANWLTLSSLKGQRLSFITFLRIKRQRDCKREWERETEMYAYSGGWLVIIFCQQQMPGAVVLTGHTFKHNTAAFSSSGHRIERGGRRGEGSKAEENKKKDGIRIRESRRQAM